MSEEKQELKKDDVLELNAWDYVVLSTKQGAIISLGNGNKGF